MNNIQTWIKSHQFAIFGTFASILGVILAVIFYFIPYDRLFQSAERDYNGYATLVDIRRAEEAGVFYEKIKPLSDYQIINNILSYSEKIYYDRISLECEKKRKEFAMSGCDLYGVIDLNNDSVLDFIYSGPGGTGGNIHYIYMSRKGIFMTSWEEVNSGALTFDEPSILKTKTNGVYDMSFWGAWDGRINQVSVYIDGNYELRHALDGDTYIILAGDLAYLKMSDVVWESPVYEYPNFKSKHKIINCGNNDNFIYGKVKDKEWFITGCTRGCRGCDIVVGYRPSKHLTWLRKNQDGWKEKSGIQGILEKFK